MDEKKCKNKCLKQLIITNNIVVIILLFRSVHTEYGMIGNMNIA